MTKRPRSSSEPPPLLARGDQGHLRTASGQRWPVRVSEHEGDVLMLVLLVEPEELAQQRIESPML